MAVHSTAIQSSVLAVKHQHTHTVNPLIAPHVNPFLPSAISTVSVLFFSTNQCIGVTGDVSSPQCQNARRSPTVADHHHY
ncbi:unnamed protein product [Staurois parvus]|uniref:Uncharacterized protein n=1 Tax=Staurois parvus TaxID=386267 RepID=A0ABN9FQ44_9NEOB|nr:unnamed protein product [Staurois parvus]